MKCKIIRTAMDAEKEINEFLETDIEKEQINSEYAVEKIMRPPCISYIVPSSNCIAIFYT